MRIFWIICSILHFSLAATGVPQFIDELTHSSLLSKPDTPLPDPYDLQPEWWHYFDVKEPELTQRVQLTLQNLNKHYKALALEDQEASFQLMNSINVSLNALPEVRKQKGNEATYKNDFPKVYTLEQQLQLNSECRKHCLAAKSDQEELEQLTKRINKIHQHIDTKFAAYLSSPSKHTPSRFIAGLEIMSQQAAIGIAEENRRLLQESIEIQKERQKTLEEQLEVARKAFDATNYDQNQLNRDIELAQNEFEQRQNEFSRAEAAALEVHGTGQRERSASHLLAQKVLFATVNEAHAWTKLAFHKLKYNLIMHVNNLFQVDNSEMREKLITWKERIKHMAKQQKEWEKLALSEQDRIRQDQGILASNNSLMETRRQVTTATLSLLQRLDEDIANVEWLIDQLEHHIRANSNFFVRTWGDLKESIFATWKELVETFNLSLFKVFDIPITLLTLLRIIFIMVATYVLSLAIRLMICTFGKGRPDVSESTLYNMGRLAHYFVLFVGALVALCSIGLDLNHVMILAGALTFGIGFGLQSVAMNFFSGLRILFERKIKIGDYIELQNGHKGKVTEIHVQNTVIYTGDGIEVVVPNSELLNSPLVNWTLNDDFRRLHIPFSISYNNDKELVRQVVSEAAKQVPCTLNHPEYGDPQVWLVKFGDESLDFELVVWVNYKAPSFTDSKEADYLWIIETALRKNHIELPRHQRFVYLKPLPPETHDPLKMLG